MGTGEKEGGLPIFDTGIPSTLFIIYLFTYLFIYFFFFLPTAEITARLRGKIGAVTRRGGIKY